MEQLIDNTMDWARDIVTQMSKIAGASTQEEVIFILRATADELERFNIEFKKIQEQLIVSNLHQTIAQKYRREVTTDIDPDSLTYAARDKILYTKLLSFMRSGYYLLNKIRDTLFMPITYAIAFKEKGEVYYVENVDLERLMQNTMTLSNRVRITEINFARLEINLKNLIEQSKANNTLKKASEDPVYRILTNYTRSHQHKYTDRHGESRWESFKGGHLWETYRYIRAYNLDPNDHRLIHTAYENVRRGNLAYTKGGDVLEEQDKYGRSVALTSMARITETLDELIVALRLSTADDIADKLKSIFLQELTPETDALLKEYVNKDLNKLLGLLKIPH